MIDAMEAYCGRDCSACPAYAATQAGDEMRLQALAQDWYGEAEAALTRCEGCQAASNRQLNRWCRSCPVRACARMMGIQSCALCIDYPDCRHLRAVFARAPEARIRLEALRAMLRSEHTG